MSVQVNEEQIHWYSKEDYVVKKENRMAPTASISARTIALNKPAAIFEQGQQIVLGIIKQKKSIILRASTGNNAYTPFECKLNKSGDAAVRCGSFVNDVLIGELNLDFSERKRIKCPVEVDEDSKTLIIRLSMASSS